MHAAGRLEGGLVSCYEKFIDIESLKMLRVEFTPLEIDEASLAFGAHEEVGHGGHFLGAAHTMERFRECFYLADAVLHRELRALVSGAQEIRPGRRVHRAEPPTSRLANALFTGVEDMLGLARHTIKMGIMDEERRTSSILRPA